MSKTQTTLMVELVDRVVVPVPAACVWICRSRDSDVVRRFLFPARFNGVWFCAAARRAFTHRKSLTQSRDDPACRM